MIVRGGIAAFVLSSLSRSVAVVEEVAPEHRISVVSLRSFAPGSGSSETQGCGLGWNGSSTCSRVIKEDGEGDRLVCHTAICDCDSLVESLLKTYTLMPHDGPTEDDILSLKSSSANVTNAIIQFSIDQTDTGRDAGTEIYGPNSYVVYINGTIIGVTRTPTKFVSQFRKLRRARRFSEFVSVYINHHHRAVHSASDGGRICRPMIIVEKGRSRVTSDHIVVSHP